MTNKDLVRKALEGRFGRILNAREISDFTGVNLQTVKTSLRRLLESQQISKTGRGLYVANKPIPQPVEKFLNDDGWYLSGLQYGRNIGIMIFGIDDIDEAEIILRDYAQANVYGYNEDFYGIGSIPYDLKSPLNKVIEVNL